MDCQLDISSVNAFLHATSKPARLLAGPVAGHATPHCFDRLPQAVAGLMMQYLFPKHRAGEPPLYRFMRAQILQSRQPSNPAACELLYPGHSEDAIDDKRWKNGIDATFKHAQKSIARNLFSDFWRNLNYFPTFSQSQAFRCLAPAPAFEKMPCIKFLQRYMLEKALIWSQITEPFDKKRVIWQNFADLISKHPTLRTLLQDPMLQAYIKKRIVRIEHHAAGLNIQEQDQLLFPVITSMKVRLVAGGVVIASTIYSICRAVYVVLKAIAQTLRECAPYFAIACFSGIVVGISIKSLSYMLKEIYLTPDMLSKNLKIFAINASLFSLGGLTTLSYISLYRAAIQSNLPSRIQDIFYTANHELESIRRMRDNQIQNCVLIAQFLLLRRA